MKTGNFENEELKPEDKMSSPVIRVIGVGGAGVKMAGVIYQRNIPGVDVVVCDTDLSELDKSLVPVKLGLGFEIAQGEGTGGDAGLGRTCVRESGMIIEDLIKNSPDIIVIVAGMGNGTGTGASPVLARIAKECGKLALGFLTMPFLFEGQFKIMQALEGCREMREYTDSLMILNNEVLIANGESVSILEMIRPAADIWVNLLNSLSDLVWGVAISVMDLKHTLKNSGSFYAATGYCKKENCIFATIMEIKEKFKGYGLTYDIESSKRLIIKTTCSTESDMFCAKNVLDELCKFTSRLPIACEIIGKFEDDPKMDNMRISILFAGFDEYLESAEDN